MKHLLLLPLFALGFVSCTSTTPTSRIENNLATFEALPAAHKALIEQGKIANGMSKDAVYLSWGTPASTGEGQDGSKRFERWTYTALEPVYTTSFGGYYGSRYYDPYRWGTSPYSYGMGQEVHYVPRPAATVDFTNGQVTRWQRGRSF
ncbi:MAG: hypothetical protein ACSHYF_18245 [Verrucomicrobiaceae bacterium]